MENTNYTILALVLIAAVAVWSSGGASGGLTYSDQFHRTGYKATPIADQVQVSIEGPDKLLIRPGARMFEINEVLVQLEAAQGRSVYVTESALREAGIVVGSSRVRVTSGRPLLVKFGFNGRLAQVVGYIEV